MITRGPLIVRDVDVLAEASRRAAVTVSVSVATMDDEVAARLEPGVAPPRQRLRAIRILTDAGIAAGVALAPILPGLTDAPRDLAAVLAAAREAGAVHAWSNVLNLRTGRASTSSPCSSGSGRRRRNGIGGSTPPAAVVISGAPTLSRSSSAFQPSAAAS